MTARARGLSHLVSSPSLFIPFSLRLFSYPFIHPFYSPFLLTFSNSHPVTHSFYSLIFITISDSHPFIYSFYSPFLILTFLSLSKLTQEIPKLTVLLTLSCCPFLPINSLPRLAEPFPSLFIYSYLSKSFPHFSKTFPSFLASSYLSVPFFCTLPNFFPSLLTYFYRFTDFLYLTKPLSSSFLLILNYKYFPTPR